MRGRERCYCGSFTLQLTMLSTLYRKFLLISSLSLLFCFGPLNIELREIKSEKIGRWYGTDKKASYICSFSSLCLMDRVRVQWKVDVMTDVWQQGDKLFAELFSKVRVTDRVNQSRLG